MSNTKHTTTFLFILFSILLYSTQARGQAGDSLKIKEVKRYMRPCFYFNYFVTPERRARKADHYSFSQTNFGFYLPVFTKTKYNADSVTMKTINLLGIVDYTSYKPNFESLHQQYNIGRLSVGIRLFYTDGKKGIWYFGLAPFVSQETKLYGNPHIRFTGAIIYNRTVSKYFAYRFGIAQSYNLGTLLPLPVVGVRIGAVDGINLVIQIPRNIILTFPMGNKFSGSVFIRAMGGVYNISTQDSLQANQGASQGNYLASGTFAQLKRLETLQGVQINYRPSSNFSMYVALGFADKRFISFTEQNNDYKYREPFYKEKIPASLFLNVGLSIHLGKAKKVYNNILMYDMFDMNTIKTAGDNGSGPYNNDVPVSPQRSKLETIRKIKYKDVEDLITDEY